MRRERERESTNFLLILCGVLASTFLAYPAFAVTDISACQDLSVAGEYYNLTQNVSSVGTCFNVLANNITLDGNGYWINYSNTSVGNAVNVTNRDNITIKNIGAILDNNAITSSSAIALPGTTNSKVINNIITISSTNDYNTGITLSSSGSNNISSNNITSKSYGGYGIYVGFSSNNTVYSNIIVGTSNQWGFYVRSGQGNNITGGSSIVSTGYDYYFESSPASHLFRQTNFTASRKIYFYDTGSWFSYNNETSANIWLKTNRSAAGYLTRTLMAWGNTLMRWNDTNSSAGVTAGYILTGLLVNSKYAVYNTSTGTQGNPYNLTTDSSGNLPPFSISLNGNTEVKVSITDASPTILLNAPQNGFNQTSASITFNCTVYDDINLTNVTLYNNLDGTWQANGTNATGINNTEYTFTRTAMSNGTFTWNCFAYDNTSLLGFALQNYTVTIDGVPPTSNAPANASYSQGASATIGWILSDNYASGHYTVYKNGTIQNQSAWQNNTNLNIWVNTSTIGTWNYTITYNDSLGNNGTANTVIITITGDTNAPKYSSESIDSVLAGTPVKHSLYWTDDVGLSAYIFSFDNCTGSFVNETYIFSGAGNWSNVTKTINSTVGCTIRWKVYANDTSNTWNESSVYSYVTATQNFDNNDNLFWVRTDGSDSCNGQNNMSYLQNTTSCAWQTVQKAADTLASGQTVRVRSGNYTQGTQITVNSSNTTFMGDGLPTIYQSDVNTRGFYVYDKDNVTIRGFLMRNLLVGVYADYTNYLNVTGNNIETVAACYSNGNRAGLNIGHSNDTYLADNVINTTRGGINVWGFDYAYRDVVIFNNTIDIPRHSINDSEYCADDGMAIYISGTPAGCGSEYNPWNATQVCGWIGENVNISYNRVLAANRNCIAPGNTRYVYIHGNWINDCNHNGLDFHGTANVLAYDNTILNGTTGEDNAILISAGYSGTNWTAGATMNFVNNITIYNNYIDNQLLGGIFNWGNPINVTLFNNTIMTNGKGMGWQPDPYTGTTSGGQGVEFPRVVYGVRYIGNRIYGNGTTGVTIGSNSFFLDPPVIPAFVDRTNESTLFLDNIITAGTCFYFDSGNNDTYYFINNYYNCSGLYGYSTSSAIGNAYFGYYLNLRVVDENGNPVPGANITVSSTDGNYSAYSLENIYNSNGIPTTDNTRLLTQIASSYVDENGYTYIDSNYTKAIVLLNQYSRISNNYPNISRVNYPVAWQINISKGGYYTKSIYYTAGLDEFKQNKSDRTDAIVVVLNTVSQRKLLAGNVGMNWENTTQQLVNISEDKSKNTLELDQEVSNLTSWWRFDENQRTGIYDFTGKHHGSFSGLLANSNWTGGKDRYGLWLSNETAYRVAFHNSTDFDSRNDSIVCYTMWAKPTSNWTDSAAHRLAEKSEGQNTYGGGIGWESSTSGYAQGQLFLRLTNSTPSYSYDAVCYGNDVNPCSGPWLKDEWHFVSICFNLTRVTLREDNRPTKIFNSIFSSGSIGSDYAFWLGRGINATIDDVRLYRRWLTDTEIDKIRNNTHRLAGNATTIIRDAESVGSSGDIWKNISVSADIPAQTNVSIYWNYSSNNISYSMETVTNNATSGQTYTFTNKVRYGSLILQLQTANSSLTPTVYNITMYSMNASSTGLPIVSLNSPANTLLTNNASVIFNCSSTSTNQLANISLYANWSGWSQKNTTNITGTSNSSQWVNTLADGSYLWNCLAYDNAGNSSFYSSNYTFTIDTTPPAPITSLANQSQDISWIYWNWTNPANFNHSEIYLNGTWQQNTSLNYYNATNLTQNTWYQISIRTVDLAGNINTTWVNATARTVADTTPPVINITYPTNGTAFAAGTTSTRINITTDENATCRYNLTNSSFVFADGTNFTNTGGVNHSFLYSGLSNSNTYGLYYLCNDTYGNINTQPIYHTFSVSAAQVETPSGCSGCGGGSSGGGGTTTQNKTNQTTKNATVIIPAITNTTTTLQEPEIKQKAQEKINEVNQKIKPDDTAAKQKLSEAEAAYATGQYDKAYSLALEAEGLIGMGAQAQGAGEEEKKPYWIYYAVVLTVLAAVGVYLYRWSQKRGLPMHKEAEEPITPKDSKPPAKERTEPKPNKDADLDDIQKRLEEIRRKIGK